MLTGDIEGNLGDQAILIATRELIEARSPSAEITVTARRPRDLPTHFGVRGLQRGFSGLPALARAARDADLVLCGGGGLFQDDDSLVKMPYWALRLLFVRGFNRRLAGWSLGVGPLRSVSSRAFARLAFRCMASISTRDEAARSLAKALSGKTVALVPDPAHALAPAPEAEVERWLSERALPRDGRPLLGVTLRRWLGAAPRWIPNHLASRLGVGGARRSTDSERLVERVADALVSVIDKTGAHVLFLPSYASPHEGDVWMCEEVARRCPTDSVHFAQIGDARLYKGVVGHLSALLSGRMHPLLFAAGMGTPSVGLSYNPKFSGSLEQVGNDCLLMTVERLLEEDGFETLRDALLAAIETRPDRRTSQLTLAQQRCAALAEQTRQALTGVLAGAT